MRAVKPAWIVQLVARFVSQLHVATHFCRVGSSPAGDTMTQHVWTVGSSFPVAVVSQGISQSLYSWKLPRLSSTIELSSEIIVRYDWFRVIDRKKDSWTAELRFNISNNIISHAKMLPLNKWGFYQLSNHTFIQQSTVLNDQLSDYSKRQIRRTVPVLCRQRSFF